MAGGIYLPVVDFPLGNSVGVVAPLNTLNQSATTPSKMQAQCAGVSTVLAIPYGQARWGAALADLLTYNGRLVVFAVWGLGPLDALVNFTIDDANPPAGVIATHYDGTQVVPDPVLAAIYGSGYTDVLPGIAYSVVQIPPGATSGFPQLQAIWRGRKLWDPRSSTTVWSDNGGLALGDFLASTTYGAGKTVDQTKLIATANACDGLVSGVKRRRINLVLDKRQETKAWVETLRTYAGCSVLDDGSPVRLIPNRPASPVADFTWAGGNLISLGPLKSASLDAVPTVMEIQYTDTSQIPYRTASAFAPANGQPAAGKDIRLSTVQLPGITDPSQAQREAIERLNTLNLCVLSTQMETMGEGAQIEVGDRVRVSHPVGLALKEFLVTQQSGSLGRYKLDLLETDPAQYSDVVTVVSTQADTNLPNPSNPPAPTGLTLTEERYQLQNGQWTSRIMATWTMQPWPYLASTRFEVAYSGDVIYATTTGEVVGRSPPVQEAKTYTVRVCTVSTIGAASAWASATLTAQGKLMVPSNVTSLTGIEVGGEARLTAGPSIDIDFKGIEFRYGAPGVTWESAKFCDFVNTASGVGAYLVFKDAPPGNWDFLACGLDYIGQYSVTPARLNLTITSDVNAQLVGNHNFTTPATVGLAEYSIPGSAARYFVTEDGVMAATKFPAVASTYTDIGANYHASQVSSLTSEAWDIGVNTAASWSSTIGSAALSGSKIDSILLSTDGSTYQDQGSANIKATGRFSKVQSAASGTSTLKVTMGALAINATAVSRFANGSLTSATSGRTTIPLGVQPTALAAPIAVVPTGNTARTGVADNVRINPFDSASLQMDTQVVTAAANQFTRMTITPTISYVVQATDVLKFDVMCVARDPAETGFRCYPALKFADATYMGSYVTVTDITSVGAWESWAIPLNGAAGKTAVRTLCQISNLDATGITKCLIRNARIVNGSDVVQLSIWTTGAVDGGFDSGGTNQINYGLNNANCFDAYVFDNTGARLASAATWNTRYV